METGNHKNHIEKMLPLTSMQEGMLFHSIGNEDSSKYVVLNIFEITGEICNDNIVQAIQLLAYRHDALKTVVAYENLPAPAQVLTDSSEVDYRIIDLSDLDDEEKEKQVDKIADLEIKRGFLLEKDMLFRVRHVIMAKNRIKLIWCYHHIILDSWSLPILYKDFADYYEQLMRGVPIDEIKKAISEKKRQTADFSVFARWIQEQDTEVAGAYWKSLLSGYENAAEIRPLANLVHCPMTNS